MPDGSVAVVGSINMDCTLDVNRLPAVGETCTSSRRSGGLGGKGANQAVAAARAGASTFLIASIGDDDDGKAALSALEPDAVDVRFVTSTAEQATGTAIVIVDDAGDNMIVVTGGANESMPPEHASWALGELDPSVLLIQLESSIPVVVAALEAVGATRIVNAAPFNAAIVRHLDDIDILVVNEGECRALLQVVGTDNPHEVPLKQALVVTRGGSGVDVHAAGCSAHYPATRVGAIVDTSGAGDTFCGYLAAGIARSNPLPEAVETAIRAAGTAVTRRGTSGSIPRMKEVPKP